VKLPVIREFNRKNRDFGLSYDRAELSLTQISARSEGNCLIKVNSQADSKNNRAILAAQDPGGNSPATHL
jgi:hypothetical protein